MDRQTYSTCIQRWKAHTCTQTNKCKDTQSHRWTERKTEKYRLTDGQTNQTMDKKITVIQQNDSSISQNFKELTSLGA